MTLETFVFIIELLLISILMIVIHEYGHVKMLRYFGSKQAKIKFYYNSWRDFGLQAGEKKHYKHLSDEQINVIVYYGIIYGTLPIIIGGLLLNKAHLLLFIPYMFGLKHDLRLIKWK